MIETRNERETPKELLWLEGPNYAADPVIINDHSSLLLIQRTSGEWALPGGFVDYGEPALAAARREAFEETGLVVTEDGTEIYRGKVTDPRNTDRRWIETTAYLFHVSTDSDVQGNDDAQDAKWFPLDKLPDQLYGSHQAIIDRALLYQSLERGIPETTDHGHMLYEYQLRHTEHYGPVFTKEHVPEHHTDARREANSRTYLQKEFSALEHLRQHGYSHIPTHATMLNDTMLAIEGLPASHGWLWRAPTDESFHQYTTDCLAALKELETMPAEATDGTTLTPSIISFLEEGWDTLEDPEKLLSVQRKIDEMSGQLHSPTAQSAARLKQELVTIRDDALRTDIDLETALSHHDARQANIAWHPQKGVRIVDWSWAGAGVKDADTTSFLIDLAKSGHDVTPWIKDYFNPTHARLLIGFWLGHSVWPSREGNEAVRLHQVASAATAYELLGVFA